MPKTTSVLQFRPAFLELTLWRVFSINTLIFQHSLSLSHFHLQGPTHSLQCDFQREHYHSLISTNSSQPPEKMYTSCKHSLTCCIFSVRFFSTSKTTEISSNHRKKERNNMGEDTFLLLRGYWKYLVNTHRTLLLFSLFCSVNYTHTHKQTHTGIHVEQY